MKTVRRVAILGILALAWGAVTCVNPNERLRARAKRLALVTEPTGAIVGEPFAVQPMVELHDDADNKVIESNVAVTALLAIGGGTLVGTTTVDAVDGVATFTDLRVDAPGPHGITFTAADLSPAASALFTVALTSASDQVPAALSIVTQPGGGVSGSPLSSQPVVRILDSAGVVISSGSSSSLAISVVRFSGIGTLAGTTTVNAVNGVATFTDLQITGTGNDALRFSITTPALQVTSNTFSVTAAPPPGPVLTGVRVTPNAAALLPNATQVFAAAGVMSDGSSSGVAVNWTTTGGTVDAGGLYTAPSQSGNYLVIATQLGGSAFSDTAQVSVTVPPPTLTAVVLTPASAVLEYGQTQQFSATGLLGDGTSTSIAVTFTSTGGTLNASGLYTAGTSAGNFRVIARSANGLADTSAITISAPTITSISLAPASASLRSGQTQQFSVSATLSNGGTQTNPTVTYTATGGTITTGGQYTAGNTAGTFRVIARANGGAADTSAVTITPPTVTAIIVTPVSATVVTGQTQQFTAAATLSNGGVQTNPSVTWSATGGIISTGGLYTAGSSTGTFRVVAVQSGGSFADTSSVNITAPGTGFYANRPANYTRVISDYGFDEPVPGNDGDQPFGTGGWSMIGGSPITIQQDATAPNSPPSTLQWRFDPGPGGGSVGNVYRSINTNISEVYVAFSVWHDPNFEWNTISNKLFYWEDGNIILQSMHNGSYLSLYIGAYDLVYDPNGYDPVTSDFNGKWVNIEYIIRRGNPGLLKVWMNGRLVSNYSVQVPTISGTSELKLDSTWGGGGTRLRTSFRRIDHVLIATP